MPARDDAFLSILDGFGDEFDVGFGFGFGPCEPPGPVEVPGSMHRELSPAEERRRRRMISNRESARRSRMRKQRHLEDLRLQADRLRAENRDLAGRIGTVTHYSLLVRRDNERLLSESVVLRRRLADIQHAVLLSSIQRLAAVPPPASVLCGGLAGEMNTSASSLMA